jgi:hypothetical protein
MPAAGHAQSLDDKYWVEIAGFWPNVNSTVEINDTTHPNIPTNVDLEGDLALSHHQVLPSVNAGLKLGRFVFAGDYYSLRRSATHSISRDINFDGVTYPVGGAVSSAFDSDIYRLTIGYDIFRRKNWELGAAIGGHVTNFAVSLAGQVTTPEHPSLTSESHRRSALAPLPTIGAYGAFRIAPKVVASARVDWLSLSAGDYDGRLWNVQGAIGYRALKNIQVGLMYRYVDYRLDVNKSTWNGHVTYSFNGPAVFLRVGFP